MGKMASSGLLGSIEFLLQLSLFPLFPLCHCSGFVHCRPSPRHRLVAPVVLRLLSCRSKSCSLQHQVASHCFLPLLQVVVLWFRSGFVSYVG